MLFCNAFSENEKLNGPCGAENWLYGLENALRRLQFSGRQRYIYPHRLENSK
jgi:hypothetical protein